VSEADRSPSLRKLAAHCSRLPGVVRRRRWGETAYAVEGRTFAFLGAEGDPEVTVKVGRRDRERLLGRPQVERARYVGRLGWVTVRVRDPAGLDLAFEAVDLAYAHARSRRPRGQRASAIRTWGTRRIGGSIARFGRRRR
jgi:predicted DNA-binding protein (MmcQ/YjbR family)